MAELPESLARCDAKYKLPFEDTETELKFSPKKGNEKGNVWVLKQSSQLELRPTPPVESVTGLPSEVRYGSPSAGLTDTATVVGTSSLPTLSNSRTDSVTWVCRYG